MRVISGSCKGRNLVAVPGKRTRPTTDKVKESIFNMLESAYFDGGLGLDLYAGTGALGIEGLSRGLDRVIFIDLNRSAIEVVNQNLIQLDLIDQSEVYKTEATRALKAVAKRALKFHLIFLDPPYAKQNIVKQLSFIAEHDLLSSNGFIIVETGKNEEIPEAIETLFMWKIQQYGDTVIRVYRKGGCCSGK